MTTNPTNNPPQKVKKKPQPKPHYSPSPFRRGEKKSSGTCKGAGQGCVWDFLFFPCLENLPDYFLTFPELSAQEPGWTWGSIFSSLLCLPSRSPHPRLPIPKVHFFGLVLHGSEVPVAAGSAGLAFPEFFQHPGRIQTSSFGDSGEGRSQKGG